MHKICKNRYINKLKYIASRNYGCCIGANTHGYILVDIQNRLSNFAKRKTLIEIKTQEIIPSSRWSFLTCLTKGGPMVNGTNTFKQLNNNTKHDTMYKVQPSGAVSRICKLKLNTKK